MNIVIFLSEFVLIEICLNHDECSPYLIRGCLYIKYFFGNCILNQLEEKTVQLTV